MMNNLSSGSCKKGKVDTRNNWVTMVFVTKCRFNCFLKQSHIDTCMNAFREHERFGFKFDEIGFAGNHVHFLVDIPKKYSVEVAEIMLKSYSSKCLFEQHPGFRKLYPRGSFWSGYEHHQGFGVDPAKALAYIENQGFGWVYSKPLMVFIT